MLQGASMQASSSRSDVEASGLVWYESTVAGSWTALAREHADAQGGGVTTMLEPIDGDVKPGLRPGGSIGTDSDKWSGTQDRCGAISQWPDGS